MRGIFTMMLMLSLFGLKAQENFNMTLVSNLDYPEQCNDIWGYVAPDGTEYAILGTVEATAVISLADPANPNEVAYIDGETSTWRDMKSWGDFVYVTTDVGNDGLLIIDMTGAPNNVTWEFWTPQIDDANGDPGQLGSCHNIYIDENGFAYLSGCSNINEGGVLIFDVHTTPGQPIYIGPAAPIYSHDNFVRGDTLWSSDITSGFFSVQDLSDKSNVTTWATQTTTTNFTHNAWLSDDGNYLFTTDERPNAFVDAYDVSDLGDIELLDSYQPSATAGNGVIPHNTHFINNYLVTSWYTDGIVIVDASHPDNMIKVGAYDTFLGPDGGFAGCWGAYPWLPSGLILASDMQSGLYVLQPDYQRAGYLEGIVTDADTGLPINNAKVQIIANEAPEEATDFMGEYQSGYAVAGNYQVIFTKPGYETLTTTVDLINGEVSVLNVAMIPLASFSLSLNLINADNGDPIFLGSFNLFDDVNNFNLTTNTQGVATVGTFFEGTYTVYAGAWGFLHEAITLEINETTGPIEVALTPGYQDDFIFNLGWDQINNANSGQWERGVPIPTTFQGQASNVDVDIQDDLGDQCYMTDNGGGGAGDADVDDGEVILISPLMDLTIYDNPEIRYHAWFFNDGGGGGSGPPNDFLEVTLSNGIENVILETISESQSNWRAESVFFVADFLEVTENMQISFRTLDQPDTGHLVEAGVDAFIVVEGESTSTLVIDPLALQLEAFPNPFKEEVTLSYQLDEEIDQATLILINALGQTVIQRKLNNQNGVLELGQELIPGMYFVQILGESKRSPILKVVKH